MKTLAIALLLCFLALPASARPVKVTDNLGRQVWVDQATLETPGAGSGLGSVIGPVATLPPDSHMFDLQIAVDGSQAQAATGFTVFYYAAPTFKLGFRAARDLETAQVYRLSVPMDLLLWYDPFDRFLVHVGLDPFTYTVYGRDRPQIQSAVSVDPRLSFAVEVPMGRYSIQADVGLAYVVSLLGSTDETAGSHVKDTILSGGLAFNWRLR